VTAASSANIAINKPAAQAAVLRLFMISIPFFDWGWTTALNHEQIDDQTASLDRRSLSWAA
jgi:hypothetical protein